MRCIPLFVTQEELKSKKAHIETRGTSNKAVKEGDPKCTNLTRLNVEALFLIYDPLQLF